MVAGSHCRIIDGICACVCVPSHGEQMKYSSASAAIDQSCGTPVMDSTALIAPPMPSVSLTRTLLRSHSFVYPPLFFPFSPPLSFSIPTRRRHHHHPPPPSCYASSQTETNHSFNEIKVASGVVVVGKCDSSSCSGARP